MIKPIGRRGGRDCTRYHPSGGEGWMVARRSGGSLEELQQFRNCFPFFCSLNCFPRSAVLFEAVASASDRSSRCPPFWTVDTPWTMSVSEYSLDYTANFSLLSLFRRRNEAIRVGQKPEKASSSPSGLLRSD